MKPTYTVRLTADLDADERARIAQRVAGTMEVPAERMEQLLARGEGRDLIRPSAPNVANRLVRILAEAGAPVRLVPIEVPAEEGGARGADSGPAAASDATSTREDARRPAPEQAEAEPDREQAEAEPDREQAQAEPDRERAQAEPDRERAARAASRPRPDEADDDDTLLRPRRPTGPGRPEEPAAAGEPVEPVDAARGRGPAEDADVVHPDERDEPVEPAEPATPSTPATRDEAAEPAAGAQRGRSVDAAAPEDEVEPAAGAVGPTDVARREQAEASAEVEREPSAGVEPEDEPIPDRPAAATPEDTGVREAPRESPPASAQDPRGPAPAPNQGNALLGAAGAAVLGIGAYLAMSFMPSALATGVLLLAVLSLGLSFAGLRRTIWLPGLGALGLIAWGLFTVEGGVVPSLAQHWEWFAMIAGALLVMLAGVQESQRPSAE